MITLALPTAHSDLDDLYDVQKELIQVSAKWRSIGIALRLKPNILDGIEMRYNGDPPTCLTSTLTEWLNKNYNVKRFGEPTWQALVKVVDDPAGGADMALARDMARRHKAGGMSGRLYSVTVFPGTGFFVFVVEMQTHENVYSENVLTS